MFGERRELLAERGGVRGVQVYLILGAAQAERTVSAAGPPSRSSSSLTVVFLAIMISVAATGLLHGTGRTRRRNAATGPPLPAPRLVIPPRPTALVVNNLDANPAR